MQTFLVVNGDMQTEGEQAGPVKKKCQIIVTQ